MNNKLYPILFVGLLFGFALPQQTSAQWVKQNIPAINGLNKLQSVGTNVLWTANADRGNLGLGIDPMHRPQFIRTENGGSTYSLGQLFPIDFYFIEPFDAKTAYYLAGSFSEPTYLFRRTTDGGLTWQNMPFTPPTYPGLVHFYDAKNGIYVGDPDNLGFYVASTTDSGKTFTRLPQNKLPQPLATEFTFGGDYQILGDNIFMTCYDYVANAWRIMRSTDRGQSWTSGAWIAFANNYFELRFAFTDANNGMILRGIGKDIQKPLYTTDGGATWLEGGNLPGLVSYPIDNVPNTQNLMAFFQDTVRRVLFTVLTNDLGKTWNTPKDVGSYQLDARYTQFGLAPFVNGQLEVVDNNTAWAEFTNFEIHHYNSPTTIVPEKPDLDIEMTADNNGLPLWGSVKFTLTIKNRGISKATGVKVNWLPPYKRTNNGAGPFAYQAAYASKGQYDSWNGVWSINELQPSETQTATFHLFVLQNTTKVTQTAQVIAENEQDLDSAPNNMMSTAREDDEAVFTSVVNTNNFAEPENNNVSLISFKAFPNPTNDKLTVFYKLEGADYVTLTLTDVNGRIVYEKMTPSVKNGSETISLQDLAKGVYVLKMTTLTESKTEKIVRE